MSNPTNGVGWVALCGFCPIHPINDHPSHERSGLIDLLRSVYILLCDDDRSIRLRSLHDVQSCFFFSCFFRLLLLLHAHLAVEISVNIISYLARCALLMLFDRNRITFADSIISRTRFARDECATSFCHMFIFITVHIL
jgi:hypothetical protein